MWKSMAFVAASAVLLATTACVVQDKKNGNGDNVRIHTPVGGMEVHTNDVHPADVGLPVYPGATLAPTDKHDNDKSADIDMSFGEWHLRVKVIGYTSADPQDKVAAYYKKALQRYGDVLTCQNNKPVGTPDKTSAGLTCTNDARYNIDLDVNTKDDSANVKTPQLASGGFELRAGSPAEQHIVAFSTVSGTGSKFALVNVELPHKQETN